MTVRTIVQDFPQDPFHASRLLRERRDQDFSAFETDALRSLAELEDSPGARYLVTLLRQEEDESLLARAVDPASFDLARAVRVVSALRRVDPQADVRLARMLLGNALAPGHAHRALEVLEAISDGPRLVPVLLQLYRHLAENSPAKPRLLAIIAKYHRNREWIDDRLREADPLVRAVIVEAFLGESSADALSVFRHSAQDPHPKVAAAAAVGLYQAGLVESLPLIGARLGASPLPEDRGWAAWAMGRTQDPRFLRDLSLLVKDADAQVRKQAFQSLGTMKKAATRAPGEKPKEKCSLRFIKLHRASTEGVLHILFEVAATEDRAPVRKIHPLEVVVTENGLPVFEYTLQERVKYPKPGVYDLHFHSRGTGAAMLAVEVAVHTERHEGSHTTYWFGD